MLELDFAEALFRQSPTAAALAEAAVVRAHAVGDEAGEALGRVGAAYYRTFFAADPAIDELEALIRRALPLLERAGDDAGLVHVWSALAYGVANWRCRFEDYAHASEQALHHARRAGQPISNLFRLESALVHGPRPANEALRTLDRLLPKNPHPSALLARAWLLTMLARFEEAASLAKEAGDRWRELTGDDWVDYQLGDIALSVDDHENAAVHLRRFYNLVEARGQRAIASTYASQLARSLCGLGRYDEAETLARIGRATDETKQDILAQTLWRRVQALVHSSRDQHLEAAALAVEAVAIIGAHRRTEHARRHAPRSRPGSPRRQIEAPKPKPHSPRPSNATSASTTSHGPRKCANDSRRSKLRRPETQADAAFPSGSAERLTDCTVVGSANAAMRLFGDLCACFDHKPLGDLDDPVGTGSGARRLTKHIS